MKTPDDAGTPSQMHQTSYVLFYRYGIFFDTPLAIGIRGTRISVSQSFITLKALKAVILLHSAEKENYENDCTHIITAYLPYFLFY